MKLLGHAFHIVAVAGQPRLKVVNLARKDVIASVVALGAINRGRAARSASVARTGPIHGFTPASNLDPAVKDLAEMFPERFNNKTDGVTPRRWSHPVGQSGQPIVGKASPPAADRARHRPQLACVGRWATDPPLFVRRPPPDWTFWNELMHGSINLFRQGVCEMFRSNSDILNTFP